MLSRTRCIFPNVTIDLSTVSRIWLYPALWFQGELQTLKSLAMFRRLVNPYRRFDRLCCLHLQGQTAQDECSIGCKVWVVRSVLLAWGKWGTLTTDAQYHYCYHKSAKMGQIFCPETSVRNYHYLLRNSPEELSSNLDGYTAIMWQNSITAYNDVNPQQCTVISFTELK